MKVDFKRKRMLVALIILAVGGVILTVLGTRTFPEPPQIATETLEQIGKRLGESFNFTDEQKTAANPLFAKLRSGGPPKDGIPSVDDPKFESAQDANIWLKPDDLVLGFNYKGEARAYPLRILNWHEIVNDKVVGDAVLITYCPLCFTGIAFSRVVDGVEIEFGTSGKLINSNLVMYDRASDSLWTQLGGEAIIGPNVGKELTQLPLDTLTWAQWRNAHLATLVLSRDTGFARNYDVNPYEGYNTNRDTFGTQFSDDRLHPKAVIYGVEVAGKFKAYSKEQLEKTGKIADNFARQTLEITRDNVGKVQIKNKTTGAAIIPTISYWFAWVSFHPDTELAR